MRRPIGSRWLNNILDKTYEVVGWDDPYNKVVCIDGTSSIEEWSICNNDPTWAYVGNFSKSHNLTNLYDILEGR